MDKTQKKSFFPKWARDLIAAGELIVHTTKKNKDKKISFALCLPRIQYAAAFLGLGIIKANCSCDNTDSEIQRLRHLVGKWVSFEGVKKKAVVGILEQSEDGKEFSIREYSKIPKEDSMTEEEWKKFQPPNVVKAWTGVMPKYYHKVQPTMRTFNEKRRVGTNQIANIVAQNNSVLILSNLLATNLAEVYTEATQNPFCIIGNKTRLLNELDEPLSLNDRACLAEVLRPKGLAQYSDSYCCDIVSARNLIKDQDPQIVIIECSRNLPDILVSTRGSNRVILLSRNSPAYEECVESLMEEFSFRKNDEPKIKIPPSPAIFSLPFYHK